MGVCVHLTAGLVPSGELVFIRSAVSLVCLLPFCARDLPKLFRRSARSFWFRNVAGAVAIVCFFSNLQRAGVGPASMYIDLAPVVVLAFAVVVQTERISRPDALLIVTAASGRL
jgi:drug/metabolite transporter (DMT)-like permease